MSDYILINGELYHHGVKGMKWGVRKAYDVVAGYGYRKQKKKLINMQTRPPEQHQTVIK